MKFLRLLIFWARRLPWRFTALFLSGILTYLLAVSALAAAGQVPGIAGALARLLVLLGVPAFLFRLQLVIVGLEGITVVLLLLAGVLLNYNLAAWLYRWLRPKPGPSTAHPGALRWPSTRNNPAPHDPVAASPGRPGPGARISISPLAGHPLDRFCKIGIILAGGGAKGAYQAGAMKAIYEFLEQNRALGRVKMISGTSIGAWNAMFWLAGLVRPGPGGASAHEQWWRSISVGRLVEFDTYWPLRGNHFLRNTPWQEDFDQLFLPNQANLSPLAPLFGPAPPMHFYFTRSNVELGRLEFATNRRDIWSARPHFQGAAGPPKTPVPCGCCEVIQGDAATALARARRAVFASMDIPPLFPFARIGPSSQGWYEDGGVVENLPVRFGTEIEECDLLFVLPLNASFAEPVNHTSVLRRVSRVLDVRQGVIERNAFKLAYLYNELARSNAAGRTHKPVSLFAICPQKPLAINTAEFWKAREAAHAFDLMYAATRCELAERFEMDTDPNWIRMTLVSPQGERSWVDNF